MKNNKMAIICLLSLLPSISVLANENYITDPATSLRGKSDSAVPTRLQQNGKTITGIVQDALGPIAGANIIVKGTTNGNITDMDGKFMLENVPANATLVISYIGFTPKTSKCRIRQKLWPENWPVYRYNKSEGNRDKRPQSVCAGPAPSRHPAPRCMLSTDIRWENKT